MLAAGMRSVCDPVWMKREKAISYPGSLNVVSCVTNDLNVISCRETQRIQFSRLGPIFLPDHFLPSLKQVCVHQPMDFRLSSLDEH